MPPENNGAVIIQPTTQQLPIQPTGINSAQVPPMANQNAPKPNTGLNLKIILALFLLLVSVISATAFLMYKTNKENKNAQEAKQKTAEASNRSSEMKINDELKSIGESSPGSSPSINPTSDAVKNTTGALYGIYDGQYYSLYIPTSWTKTELSQTLTASDQKSVRSIKVVVSLYSQTFVDKWKKAAEFKKEFNVDHARFLTPQCSLNGNYCTRTHFVWNEDQRKFATLTVHWEKAPDTISNIQNGVETDPSVNLFETNLFRNFKFN